MKKTIRLTESELRNIVNRSVKKILREWEDDEYTDQYPYNDINRLEHKYEGELSDMYGYDVDNPVSEVDTENIEKLEELGLEQCVGHGVSVPENFLNRKGQQILKNGGKVYEWQICVPNNSSFSPEYNFATGEQAVTNCNLYLKQLRDPQNIQAIVFVMWSEDGKVKVGNYATWENGQWS